MDIFHYQHVPHITAKIFLQLSPRSLANCLLVSKSWNRVLKADLGLDKKPLLESHAYNCWLRHPVKKELVEVTEDERDWVRRPGKAEVIRLGWEHRLARRLTRDEEEVCKGKKK